MSYALLRSTKAAAVMLLSSKPLSMCCVRLTSWDAQEPPGLLEIHVVDAFLLEMHVVDGLNDLGCLIIYF